MQSNHGHSWIDVVVGWPERVIKTYCDVCGIDKPPELPLVWEGDYA